MAEQVIPTIPHPNPTQTVTLDGNECRMTFHWNLTEKKWYMNFEQLTEGYVLNGLAVVPGCSILEPYATPELGHLMVIDSEGKNRNPNFEDFGDIFVLMYIPLADLT